MFLRNETRTMIKQQIKPGKSIDSYLAKIIQESVKSTLQRRSLQEKEKQDVASGEKKSASKPAGPEMEKLKKAEISADDIIEKLNTIRSGKSFKDESISSKLTQYIEDLSSNEKVALLAFLKGISQVVSGEIEPEAAVEPDAHPADIEMKKTSGPQKKTIKPTVIKTPEKEEKKSKPVEDTTGPVPITPKKK